MGVNYARYSYKHIKSLTRYFMQLFLLRFSKINIKQLVGNYVQDEQENSYCIYRNRRIRYG